MEEHGDEKKRAMYGMGGVQAMCDGGKRSVFALRVVLTLGTLSKPIVFFSHW